MESNSAINLQITNDYINNNSNLLNEDQVVTILNSFSSSIKKYIHLTKSNIKEGKANISNNNINQSNIELLSKIDENLAWFIKESQSVFKKLKYIQKNNNVNDNVNIESNTQKNINNHMYKKLTKIKMNQIPHFLSPQRQSLSSSSNNNINNNCNNNCNKTERFTSCCQNKKIFSPLRKDINQNNSNNHSHISLINNVNINKCNNCCLSDFEIKLSYKIIELLKEFQSLQSANNYSKNKNIKNNYYYRNNYNNYSNEEKQKVINNFINELYNYILITLKSNNIEHNSYTSRYFEHNDALLDKYNLKKDFSQNNISNSNNNFNLCKNKSKKKNNNVSENKSKRSHSNNSLIITSNNSLNNSNKKNNNNNNNKKKLNIIIKDELIKKLNYDIKIKNKTIERNNISILDLKKSIINYEEQIKETKEMFDQIKKSNLNNINNSKKRKNQKINGSVDDISCNNNNYEKIINNLTKKIETLKKEISENNNKIIILNKDILKFKKEIQIKSFDNSELIKNLNKSKSEINKLKNSISLYENKVKELTNIINNNINEENIDESDNKNSEVIDELNEKILELKKINFNKDDENFKLTSKVLELTTKISNYELKISKVNDENKLLNKNNNLLNNELLLIKQNNLNKQNNLIIINNEENHFMLGGNNSNKQIINCYEKENNNNIQKINNKNICEIVNNLNIININSQKDYIENNNEIDINKEFIDIIDTENINCSENNINIESNNINIENNNINIENNNIIDINNESEITLLKKELENLKKKISDDALKLENYKNIICDQQEMINKYNIQDEEDEYKYKNNKSNNDDEENIIKNISPLTHKIILDKTYKDLHWYLITLIHNNSDKIIENIKDYIWINSELIEDNISKYNKFQTEKEYEQEIINLYLENNKYKNNNINLPNLNKSFDMKNFYKNNNNTNDLINIPIEKYNKVINELNTVNIELEKSKNVIDDLKVKNNQLNHEITYNQKDLSFLNKINNTTEIYYNFSDIKNNKQEQLKNLIQLLIYKINNFKDVKNTMNDICLIIGYNREEINKLFNDKQSNYGKNYSTKNLFKWKNK